MHVVEGVAHAGKPKPPLGVISARALENYRLWVAFNTGEIKIFDFKPLLDRSAFLPLVDKEVFHGVTVKYDFPEWKNGEIDIAPERLYKEGVQVQEDISC